MDISNNNKTKALILLLMSVFTLIVNVVLYYMPVHIVAIYTSIVVSAFVVLGILFQGLIPALVSFSKDLYNLLFIEEEKVLSIMIIACSYSPILYCIIITVKYYVA